jgi:pimeloyl-ACP methyl ester carboxylesterase
MTCATRTFLPGLEERWTDLRGARLRWFEGGTGPTVLLLHGFGGAASNWALVAPRLADGHRVIVPDLPGHGGSAPLPAPPETLDPFADRIAELIGVCGSEPQTRVLAAGHSLGGVVALRLARRHPQLVAGLLLAGCAGIVSTTRRSERLLMLTAFLKPGRRASRWRRAIARNARLRTLAFGSLSVADPRGLEPLAANAFLAGSGLYTDLRVAGDALVRTDPRLDLAQLRCPSLVLHGADDAQVPLADAFEYARRLRAPLRVVADCGHLVIGERPTAVLDAITRLEGLIEEGDFWQRRDRQ